MTYIIIAIIILLVGAAAEITAYVFTDKLLKKKEDGLNRRKAELDKREKSMNPTYRAPVTTTSRSLKRLWSEHTISLKERYLYGLDYFSKPAKAIVLRELFDIIRKVISVRSTENEDGSVTFYAELWVAEGGPDGVS